VISITSSGDFCPMTWSRLLRSFTLSPPKLMFSHHPTVGLHWKIVRHRWCRKTKQAAGKYQRSRGRGSGS
jgi:hypothetical protein